MPVLPQLIRDSRDAVRTLPSPLREWLQPLSAHDPRHLDLAHLRHRMTVGDRLDPRRAIKGVVVGTLIGTIACSEMPSLFDDYYADGAMLLLVPLAIAAATGYLMRRRPLTDQQAVSRELSRIRLCLVCTYELTGLRPEQDGCTVCPECGASWRLDPSTAPHQERSDA